MLYALAGLGVLLVAVAAYFFLTRKATVLRSPSPVETDLPPLPKAQLAKLRQRQGLWGYRVESHCRAASRLAGRRFALDHEPPVPATGCEIGHCRCVLAGLAEQRQLVDRRSGSDRRHSIRMEESDRRAARPRRRSDLNTWGGYGHL